MYQPVYLVGLLALSLLAACGAQAPTRPATTPVAAVITPLPTVTPPQQATTPPPASPTPERSTPTSVPPATSTPQAEASSASPTPGLDTETYATLGSPDAPITIYEFSDFGCPACRHYALTTFPDLREEYIETGKVYYIFKDYPIVSNHGGMAAQAAECAGEQGFYWQMHDQLFLDPAEWDASPEAAQAAFQRYAEAHTMDADALAACVAEGRYQADVDRDVEEAMEIGWFGTPTFFINRKMLSGAQPIEVFRQVLDRELREQNNGE
jgi:protein-disulfide isomerase